MNKMMIASFLAVYLATTGALAGGDKHHGMKQEARAHGHAAGLGRPGDPAKVTREVEVEMNDSMRFMPADVRVKRGDTIRFILKNAGQLKHEMVLGTMKELKEHAELMRQFPEMEHADPNQASVDPGKTGEIVWQFTRSGTFDFACLQPGHFEAGMVGRVRVSR